jgi:hypothetical protein
MCRFVVRFSESEASDHTPSLADFTTNTLELKFSVHTMVLSSSAARWKSRKQRLRREARSRRANGRPRAAPKLAAGTSKDGRASSWSQSLNDARLSPARNPALPRGVGDVHVRLLAQASHAYRAHNFARYPYRHAAAQHRDVGGDERRSTWLMLSSISAVGRCSRAARSRGPRLPAEHRPSAQKQADLRPDQPRRLPRAHGAAVHLPSPLAEPSGPRLNRGSLH